MKKHIIFGNTNYIIDKQIKYIRMNETEMVDDDDAVYDQACNEISSWHQDEYMNLDMVLEGRIIVIASLGLWNGRKPGYKIMSRNLDEILNCCGESGEVFFDGNNVKGYEHHHDGTNYYEFRMIREDRNIQNLLDDIYNGKAVSRKRLNYYTKSLRPFVQQVYGF